MEALIELERTTFRRIMEEHGAPPADPKTMTMADIRVYQSGAFNLVLAAPGGPIEIGPDGKQVLPDYCPNWWHKMPSTLDRCPVCQQPATEIVGKEGPPVPLGPCDHWWHRDESMLSHCPGCGKG